MEMGTINCKARLYIFPVKAIVKVADEEFHRKGDVNWDGVIDEEDLNLLREAYGSRPGDPNWNPDADLDGDGYVDVRDIVTCAQNQGLVAPEYVTPFTIEVPEGRVVLISTYRGQQIREELTVTEANTKTVVFIYSLLGYLTRSKVIES